MSLELNKVYRMDAKELLKQFPDDKNIVIVTDPPYGINLNLKWLSEMNIAEGKQPNKTDNKIENDNLPFDATHLFSYKRRLIFGFPERETRHSICSECNGTFETCKYCGFTMRCPRCDQICKACYEMREDEK